VKAYYGDWFWNLWWPIWLHRVFFGAENGYRLVRSGRYHLFSSFQSAATVTSVTSEIWALLVIGVVHVACRICTSCLRQHTFTLHYLSSYF